MPKSLAPFRPAETIVKVEGHHRPSHSRRILLSHSARLMNAGVQIQFSAEPKGQTLFTRHYFSAAYFR
jgi:hypothetical protein